MKEFSSLFSLILNVDHRLSLTRYPEKGVITLTVKLGEDQFEKQVMERNNQENGKICCLESSLPDPFEFSHFSFYHFQEEFHLDHGSCEIQVFSFQFSRSVVSNSL